MTSNTRLPVACWSLRRLLIIPIPIATISIITISLSIDPAITTLGDVCSSDDFTLPRNLRPACHWCTMLRLVSLLLGHSCLDMGKDLHVNLSVIHRYPHHHSADRIAKGRSSSQCCCSPSCRPVEA